jgi:hypothetical protein
LILKASESQPVEYAKAASAEGSDIEVVPDKDLGSIPPSPKTLEVHIPLAPPSPPPPLLDTSDFMDPLPLGVQRAVPFSTPSPTITPPVPPSSSTWLILKRTKMKKVSDKGSGRRQGVEDVGKSPGGREYSSSQSCEEKKEKNERIEGEKLEGGSMPSEAKQARGRWDLSFSTSIAEITLPDLSEPTKRAGKRKPAEASSVGDLSCDEKGPADVW